MQLSWFQCLTSEHILRAARAWCFFRADDRKFMYNVFQERSPRKTLHYLVIVNNRYIYLVKFMIHFIDGNKTLNIFRHWLQPATKMFVRIFDASWPYCGLIDRSWAVDFGSFELGRPRRCSARTDSWVGGFLLKRRQIKLFTNHVTCIPNRKQIILKNIWLLLLFRMRWLNESCEHCANRESIQIFKPIIELTLNLDATLRLGLSLMECLEVDRTTTLYSDRSEKLVFFVTAGRTCNRGIQVNPRTEISYQFYEGVEIVHQI